MTWEAVAPRAFASSSSRQKVRGRRVVRRSTITEVEVDQYLAQNRDKFDAGLKYHAYHIAITVEATGSPPPGSRRSATIDEIAVSLAGGADFTELARTRAPRTPRAAIWAG